MRKTFIQLFIVGFLSMMLTGCLSFTVKAPTINEQLQPTVPVSIQVTGSPEKRDINCSGDSCTITVLKATKEDEINNLLDWVKEDTGIKQFSKENIDLLSRLYLGDYIAYREIAEVLKRKDNPPQMEISKEKMMQLSLKDQNKVLLKYILKLLNSY